jgi:hypothetical protein
MKHPVLTFAVIALTVVALAGLIMSAVNIAGW